MKILLYNDYYYPNVIGGAEVFTQMLAEGLAKKGHEVTVVCMRNEKKSIETINGVLVYRLKNIKILEKIRLRIVKYKKLHDVTLFFNGVFNLWTNSFGKVLKSLKPDVVHTQNSYYVSPYVWRNNKVSFHGKSC